MKRAFRVEPLLEDYERVRDDLLAAGVGRPERYVALPPASRRR